MSAPRVLLLFAMATSIVLVRPESVTHSRASDPSSPTPHIGQPEATNVGATQVVAKMPRQQSPRYHPIKNVLSPPTRTLSAHYAVRPQMEQKRYRRPIYQPLQYKARRPVVVSVTPNRRQQQAGLHAPPFKSSHPPTPEHVIYSKPPPEVIYYGSNPPPLDYSPPASYRRPPVRPYVPYSTHHQEPEDHDIMNDLDMYIPDDEGPSKSASSFSPMTSMMMPLMMLGLTLPALGFVYTYLSRRRRRRRDIGQMQDQYDLDRYTTLLVKAGDKFKKHSE